MPCLLVTNKRLVKTVRFKNPSYIGDPINAVKIYNDKEVDELILLDINAAKVGSNIDFDLITSFAEECFMPLTYGGGVKTLEDFKMLFRLGIEKVIVNSVLFDDGEVVSRAVQMFGSQSVVASIDVVKNEHGDYSVYSHSNRRNDRSLLEYLEYVIGLGVGEIMLTAVDREGTWSGYDVELIHFINKNIDIPLIANGGCGKVEDLKELLFNEDIQAASIGSMAVYQKKGMGVLIRFPKRQQVIDNE